MGAVYMSESYGLKKSRHIDIRYHFIREYVDQGIVKIVFVKSEDNKDDPLTKNLKKDDMDKNLGSVLKQKVNSILEFQSLEGVEIQIIIVISTQIYVIICSFDR